MVDNFIKLEKGKYIFLRNLIQRSKVEWPKRSRNVEKGSLANHCHLLVFYTKNLCVKPRYFVETEQKEQQFHYRHCNFYLVVNLDYWKPLYTFAWKEKKTLTGLKFGKKGSRLNTNGPCKLQLHEQKHLSRLKNWGFRFRTQTYAYR